MLSTTSLDDSRLGVMPVKAQPSKREKYTPRACRLCQQRKVKVRSHLCSGEPVCSNCRMRNADCVYSDVDGAHIPRKSRKRSQGDFESIPQPTTESQKSDPGRPSKTPDKKEVLRHQIQQLQRSLHITVHQYNQQAEATEDKRPAESPSLPTGTQDESSAHKAKKSPINLRSNLSGETETDCHENGELDAFKSLSPWSGSLAVCSQIRALRLSAGQEPDFLQEAIFESREKIKVTLPKRSELSHLLHVFFREFTFNFPCLHYQNIQGALSEAFRLLGYSDRTREISVSVAHYKTIGILFNILAFAEPFSHTMRKEERPGWGSYLQGRKVVQHFEGCTRDDLDDVLYHVISAAYLFQGESLRRALQHLAQGYQAAINIRLNNQSQWENQSPGLAYHQSLWWILYFLDKRITQRCGMAYLIRQNEVAVEEPQNRNLSGLDGVHLNFLQSMVIHGKLWTFVWDNFFAANAAKAKSWYETESADAKILVSQRQTHRDLQWQTDKIRELAERGETELQIRRRLMVFLRYQFLRLSIRHKALQAQSDDLQRRQSSFFIASETIDAMTKYMSMYNAYQSSGFWLTSSLVECTYYVSPEILNQPDCIPTQTRRDRMREATDLLATLAKTVGAARRAFGALECIMGTEESQDELVPVGSFIQWNMDKLPSVSNGDPIPHESCMPMSMDLTARPQLRSASPATENNNRIQPAVSNDLEATSTDLGIQTSSSLGGTLSKHDSDLDLANYITVDDTSFLSDPSFLDGLGIPALEFYTGPNS